MRRNIRTSDNAKSRWLLLIHRIPARPPYLRVKAARRLLRIGAVAIKNTVYVLPNGDAGREDFEWVTKEIIAGGGESTICEVRFVEGVSDAQLKKLFNDAREAGYREMAGAARALAAKLSKRSETHQTRLRSVGGLSRLKRGMEELARIDFFHCPTRQLAERALADLEERRHSGCLERDRSRNARSRRQDYRGCIWVTRRDIHIDRMASAWLVRRFVDPTAHFRFVPTKGYRPKTNEVRFDMFEGEFTHEGDRCTFEVLIQRLDLKEPALRPIAEIVHDIDLKDGKFHREEAVGLERLLTGIGLAHKDDEERLAKAAGVFDSLYEYFGRKGN